MGSKKLTDFTTQVTLNPSTRLYGVPYSGGDAFTDTQLPISVLFDTPTFTGTITGTAGFNLAGALTAASLAATTGTIGGANIVTVSASQTLTNKTLTTPVISTISNTGTLTLPTTSDTLVGRATTDTLTNKTISGGTFSGTIAGTPTFSGNITFTSTITPSSTNGIVGTATNDNANAKSVGEVLTANVASGSAIALTTNVVANVTSISLTAGDWDVWGCVSISSSAGASVMSAGVNTTSATIRSADQGGTTNWVGTSASIASMVLSVPTLRLSLATTTTVFLVAFSTFASGTCSAYGRIDARRRR